MIPRIVRRTPIEQLLEPIVRVTQAVRRASGMLLFAALGLATLGAIAGLGLRSLPDEAEAPAVSAASHAVDATATERLLARAPLRLRVDRTIPIPPASTVAAVPVRTSPAPAHAALAHTARKHTLFTVVAHR